MREILTQFSPGAIQQIHVLGFLLCLAVSVVAALITELMYRYFYEGRATGSQIHRAFVLLGPSITMLFVCIQLSLPLSLGLLGALSIVRFRTPIKEPEEVGFLMVLIAASVACATFNFVFLGILYIVILALLWIRRLVGARASGGTVKEGALLLSLPVEAYEASGDALDGFLREQFARIRLESVSSSEGRTSLHYVFEGARSDSWAAFQQALRKVTPFDQVNAFLARQGGLR
jgi:hypothetical protein